MEEAKKKTGEEYINAMYDSKLAAQNAQLKKNYDSAMSDIAKEQEDLNRNADEASRQASVQSAQERQRWAESAAASGLSSGADAQARLAQGNQLQKSLTDISTARDTGEAELNRQRSRLADQYAAQIEEARANNDYARAEALYQEALREEQKYKEKASLMAGAGDFSEYGSYYGLTQQQMATLSAEYQKADKQAVANIMAEAGEFGPLQELYGLSDEYRAALEKKYSRTDLEAAAALMAQAGDFSLYKQLYPNLTDEQIEKLKSYWDSKQSAGNAGYSGYYGSSYSGSGTEERFRILGREGTYTADEVAELDEKYYGNGMYNMGRDKDGSIVMRPSKTSANKDRWLERMRCNTKY